jgi:hypothetical protein
MLKSRLAERGFGLRAMQRSNAEFDPMHAI